MIILKSPQEIEKMKIPCRMVAEVLELLKEIVRPGVTTLALNEIAEKEAVKRGAKPAFKGYSGYPYSLCCSVNDQVVHGMPNKRELKDGDILSLDFGVLFNGFYGDAAVTLPVGGISENAKRLLKITEESLYVAIAAGKTIEQAFGYIICRAESCRGTRIFSSTRFCRPRHR